MRPARPNTLKSNGNAAGLQVSGGATLTITSDSGGGSGAGKLNAYGGAAGIGGGYGDSCGSITISGSAEVTATGGIQSAGIGGSFDNSEGSIAISGGTIIASGPIGGIGIGAGTGYTKTTITNTPVIFANSIQNGSTGRTERSSDLTNGISASTNDVGIVVGGSPSVATGTLTLKKDFTVPVGATLTVPPGWTLAKDGKTLTNNGTVNSGGSYGEITN